MCPVIPFKFKNSNFFNVPNLNKNVQPKEKKSICCFLFFHLFGSFSLSFLSLDSREKKRTKKGKKKGKERAKKRKKEKKKK